MLTATVVTIPAKSRVMPTAKMIGHAVGKGITTVSGAFQVPIGSFKLI
jgi:hypothetical protein